ncbi:MAG TPA: DUF11 domain-containing protein [Actinomycetota bacterium]|nr:DUF11 domain-containing protein [Actinomycetota bacterium]
MDGRKHRRRGPLGPIVALALLAGQAGILTAQAAPPVDSPGPPSADGVVPVIADTQSSNDDCGQLGFDHGISIGGNGQTSSGAMTVTVTGYNGPTGFADWSATPPVHGVYVKGGPSGGALFDYPAGDTGDHDLHTPQMPDGGYYSVSHIAICWNDVPPEPDVSVVKVNDPGGVVQSGDPIAYTLSVSNDGTGTAVDVHVADQLPAGVTFADATAGCGEAASLVTCDLGDIGAGASVSVDITVTVDDGICGPIVNDAQVWAGNETEQAAGNNDSNEVTNSAECEEPSAPDLQVTKTSDADGILHEGDSFLYTITVTNVGDMRATGVELIDTLPPGDALSISVSPFPMFDGRPCVIASSIPPGGTAQATVNCGPITLGPGDSASVTFRVAATGEECGAITNVVDVEGTNEPAANVGPGNHAEAADEIACVPRIRLRKGGPALAHVGDTVAYTFSVTNTGGVDLTDIDLTDPRCDTTPDRTDDGNGDAVLAVEESWAFACDHTIVAADGDPVHDQATVTGVHGGGTVSDTDTHDIDLIHPDIDLEKSASPTSGPAGTVIVYTYTVTNTGDTTLFDISVDDDIVGHVGAIASLAAGRSSELTFEITLGSSPITNVATATGSDVLGTSVSDVDEVTVSAVAGGAGGDDGDGTGGGSPFTGSATGALSGWAAAFAVVGSLLLLAASRKPRGTDTE